MSVAGWSADPKPGDVVVSGAGRPTAKGGTRRGTTFTWLACDYCGRLSLIKGRAPKMERLIDPGYLKTRTRRCRMTPRCHGRHVVSDPSKAWETL